MKINEYIEALKEIKQLNTKNKLNLTDEIVITILQEWAKDLRSESINESKKQQYEKTKDDKPSEKQLAVLKKMNVPDIDKINKSEASQLIKESIEKRNSNEY